MERTTNDYSKVFTEVDEIFAYLPKELLKKVPTKIKKEVKENKDKEYSFIYDETKKLEEQKIYEQTKDFISLLYILYMCNKAEKERLLNVCKENDIKARKKAEEQYKVEDLFKDKKETEKKYIKDSKIEKDLVVKKQNFFTKIIEKIKKIFKK